MHVYFEFFIKNMPTAAHCQIKLKILLRTAACTQGHTHVNGICSLGCHETTQLRLLSTSFSFAQMRKTGLDNTLFDNWSVWRVSIEDSLSGE